jgi:hypothetical protein
MDTEHPLYYVLKDYYTNLDINSSNIDNSLLIQYIEDTCGMGKNAFICFKLCYSECDIMYFINFKITEAPGVRELYCYFTGKLLIKLTKNDLVSIYYLGIYKFVYFIVNQCRFIYLFK